MRPFHFYTDCVSSTAELINGMRWNDAMQDVSYRVMRARCEDMLEVAGRLGYDRWLPLSKDWSVSFHRSYFGGMPCYYFVWSGIEQVFTPGGLGPEQWAELDDEGKRDLLPNWRGKSGQAAWRSNNRRHVSIEHDDGWETDVHFEILPLAQAVSDLRDESGIPELTEDDALYGRPHPHGPLQLDSKVLVINAVQLHPARRGFGWGRRFVGAAQRWGKSQGAEASMLFAGKMANDGSPFHPVHFWRRLGYRVIAGANNSDAILIAPL